VSVQVFPKPATLESILEPVAERIAAEWKGSRRQAVGPCKVGKLDGLSQEIQGDSAQGVSSRADVTVVATANAGYVLVLTLPQKDSASVAPAWEAILRSFKAGEAAVVRQKGKTYRHVIGFSFWHPDGWTVRAEDDFLQLVPPDPGTSGGEPTEIYGIIGESVAEDGISRADDPQVLEYLDQTVGSLNPTLRRTGRPKAIETASGKGVVLEWQGTTVGGDALAARAFASIIRQHGVALIALGLKERVASREAVLREMFVTFGFGEGEKDPALAGSWTLVSTYAVSNDSPFETTYSKARMVSETSSVLEIRGDGSWIRTDTSQLIAMGAGIIIDSGPQKKTSKGKWSAGGGALYLMWDDGSWQDYKYKIEGSASGRELKLVCGSSGETWQGR
jgi:hypothetical protein